MCCAVCSMPIHNQISNICVCMCMCVRIVCANRILLPSSQLCPADESQEAPAYVYSYHAEVPAWNHVWIITLSLSPPFPSPSCYLPVCRAPLPHSPTPLRFPSHCQISNRCHSPCALAQCRYLFIQAKWYFNTESRNAPLTDLCLETGLCFN